ncbi:MAG: AmmeMemoRadiSam system radical SAM enzyme [Oscillospiraceae bacterium]|nr:AmmeMemoRadiSam system radical SAM enzyme [Oscillospiraceae bacterium]
MNERAALYWSALQDGDIRCELCPRGCLIPPGKPGFCGVRENAGGSLVCAGYGLVSAVALDPIEKKPLSLFMPGKRVLSFGGYGCNLSCPFCQNHEISADFDTRGSRRLMPQDVVRLAKQTVSEGNVGAAYTYNEPTVGFEFVYDCAALIREAGLNNIMVTNGYIKKEPLKELLPLIDAVNVDLKAFKEDFYNKIGGDLETVKQTIAACRKGCHIEVTTLIIPGENEDDIAELAAWLSSVDPEIPLHLSRFFPRHKYSAAQPTPRETIYRSAEVAGRYLKHVFTGNM